MWHQAREVMMLIMPPSPTPPKKMVDSQKNTGWSLGTRYRRIFHLLCRIFIQTWSLFQTTHILLHQLYTFFPATRILNENPKYVKKKDLLYFSTFLVRNLLLITILVCQVQSFYTQLGLQGAWGVVNTRMDNTTVFTRLMYSYENPRNNEMWVLALPQRKSRGYMVG